MNENKTEWKKSLYGFAYTSEFELAANEEVMLKMPLVTPNKRGVNDIAWQADRDDIKIYGTLSDKASSTRIWQEIMPYDEVNKVITAIKVVGGAAEANICIRVILN